MQGGDVREGDGMVRCICGSENPDERFSVAGLCDRTDLHECNPFCGRPHDCWSSFHDKPTDPECSMCRGRHRSDDRHPCE